MDSVIGIAIVALLVILVALATAALRPDKSTAPETSQSSVSSDDNLYAEEDAQFENELSKRVPDIAERFYTKVVGITFENEQGITGEMLIGYCKHRLPSIGARAEQPFRSECDSCLPGGPLSYRAPCFADCSGDFTRHQARMSMACVRQAGKTGIVKTAWVFGSLSDSNSR